MSRKKKRVEEANVTAGFGDPAGGGGPPTIGRVTPIDIQQKSFGTTVVRRGYNEREVDQFLDEVTEELARQLAENKSLREQVQRAEMRATTPLGSDAADADAIVRQARAEAARLLAEARDDAAHVVAEARGEAASILEAAHGEAGTVARPGAAGAVAAGAVAGARSTGDAGPDREFIHREREFLQSLAELIQGHAEAIREDLKRVRGTSQASGAGSSRSDDAADGRAGPVPPADGAAEPELVSNGTGATVGGPETASAAFVISEGVSARDDTASAEAATGAAGSAGGPGVAAATGAAAMAGVAVAVAATSTTTDEEPEAAAEPTSAHGVIVEAAPTEPVVAEGAVAVDVEEPTGDVDTAAGERPAGVAEDGPATAASEPDDAPAMLDLSSAEHDEENRGTSTGDPDPARAFRNGSLDAAAQGAAPDQATAGPEPEDVPEPAVEPAAVGVTAGASSGSFGRRMEETGQAPSASEHEGVDEPDGRSLRELFWGDD